MKPVPVAIFFVFILACQSGLKYPDGGYQYVKEYKPEDTNFYFLPLRDSFSKMDSFLAANEANLYQHFDEPNLSLQYVGEDVLRLYYSPPFGGGVFITLVDHDLIVKKQYPGSLMHQERILDDTENEHYNLLYQYYFQTSMGRSPIKAKMRIDSLVTIYPDLLDPTYFLSLLKKSDYVGDLNKPKYSVNKISLTAKKYREIMFKLNASGFWHMSFKRPCDESIMDGCSLRIEANTPKKYQAVTYSDCHSSIKQSEFAKVCQEIINLAGLGKDISMYSDSKIDPNDTPLIIQDIELEPMDVQESNKKTGK
jgi:hypothetical protein